MSLSIDYGTTLAIPEVAAEVVFRTVTVLPVSEDIKTVKVLVDLSKEYMTWSDFLDTLINFCVNGIPPNLNLRAGEPIAYVGGLYTTNIHVPALFVPRGWHQVYCLDFLEKDSSKLASFFYSGYKSFPLYEFTFSGMEEKLKVKIKRIKIGESVSFVPIEEAVRLGNKCKSMKLSPGEFDSRVPKVETQNIPWTHPYDGTKSILFEFRRWMNLKKVAFISRKSFVAVLSVKYTTSKRKMYEDLKMVPEICYHKGKLTFSKILTTSGVEFNTKNNPSRMNICVSCIIFFKANSGQIEIRRRGKSFLATAKLDSMVAYGIGNSPMKAKGSAISTLCHMDPGHRSAVPFREVVELIKNCVDKSNPEILEFCIRIVDKKNYDYHKSSIEGVKLSARHSKFFFQVGRGYRSYFACDYVKSLINKVSRSENRYICSSNIYKETYDLVDSHANFGICSDLSCTCKSDLNLSCGCQFCSYHGIGISLGIECYCGSEVVSISHKYSGSCNGSGSDIQLKIDRAYRLFLSRRKYLSVKNFMEKFDNFGRRELLSYLASVRVIVAYSWVYTIGKSSSKVNLRFRDEMIDFHILFSIYSRKSNLTSDQFYQALISQRYVQEIPGFFCKADNSIVQHNIQL